MLNFTIPDPHLDLTGEDAMHCMNAGSHLVGQFQHVIYPACEVL